ncbi:MAG: hypothetical protein HQL12_01720 [Candidatus Omnitrophica bacterium]|nr:hypothetical protein [Candidatus Omnitrophota bacterium]
MGTRALFIHIFILTAFLFNMLGPLPCAQAQDFRLPAPGVMVRLSPLFDPLILKGVKIHPDNPFRFDFILDKGDSQLNNDQLKEQSAKLIKYFLASLTIPEKDLWVNLSPYEKDRIIPNSFGLTEMGRDMLSEDYMLKQITASLIYPEDGVGKRFWKRVYEEAVQKYGMTDIPVNTFNKVWIVPEKAVVYENAKAGTAYVVESKLKVMLEEDYLALSKDQGQVKNLLPNNSTHSLGSQIVREIVIPELVKEVNEGKNFSQLRQVFNSLILATWYKKKIKDSILTQVYADKNKTAGVEYTSTIVPVKEGLQFKNDVEGLYQAYLKAFKKGVYNYIKEESDPVTQERIPRRYFSGGIIWDAAMSIYINHVPESDLLKGHGLFLEGVDVEPLMAPTGNLFKEEKGEINYYSELHRLSVILRQMQTDKEKDWHGHTIQSDFLVPMLISLIREAMAQNKVVISGEMVREMSRAFHVIGSNPNKKWPDGIPYYGQYYEVIKAIVMNASNMRYVEDILTEKVSQRNDGQLVSSQFKEFIEKNSPQMPKLNAKEMKGGPIIQVVDLGAPEVQDMIVTRFTGHIIIPNGDSLTLYTDGQLLEKAREWSNSYSGHRLVMTQEGTIYFSKLLSDGQYEILYPFLLDYEDSGILAEMLSRKTELRREVMEKVNKEYQKMERNGHPDARLGNLLVKVEIDQSGNPIIDVKAIDWGTKPGHAMDVSTPTGGIDLTPANMNLQTQNNGGPIKFRIDQAMLRRLQSAPGFTPVIINIRPILDLSAFLGINNIPDK